VASLLVSYIRVFSAGEYQVSPELPEATMPEATMPENS
jgi:hypothetical protein